MTDNIIHTLPAPASIEAAILEIVAYCRTDGGHVTQAEVVAECSTLGHDAKAVRTAIEVLLEADLLATRGATKRRGLRLGDAWVEDQTDAENPWICEQVVQCLAEHGEWVSISELEGEIVEETGFEEGRVFETVIALAKAGRVLLADPFELVDEDSSVCLNTLQVGVSTKEDMKRFGVFEWERYAKGCDTICHTLFEYVHEDKASNVMHVRPTVPFVTRGGRTLVGWPIEPLESDQAICLIAAFDARDLLLSYRVMVLSRVAIGSASISA